MNYVHFNLPSGARPVVAEDSDFANILRRVIKPFGWHADCIIIRGEQTSGWSWPCYSTAGHSRRTSSQNARAGELWYTLNDGHFKSDHKGYMFQTYSHRLLV